MYAYYYSQNLPLLLLLSAPPPPLDVGKGGRVNYVAPRDLIPND